MIRVNENNCKAGKPAAPSFNMGQAESAAQKLADRLRAGRPFNCIRYSGLVEPRECAQFARGPLCRECSTGDRIRSNFKQEDEMGKGQIVVCNECGRTMKEQAKGVCARCYKYVARGEKVPPLITEPAKNKVSKKKPAPDTIQADHEAKGLIEDILTEKVEYVTKPAPQDEGGYILDMDGFPGAADLFEWLEVEGDAELRSPEAQAFYILREVMRVMPVFRKRREKFMAGLQ